MRPSALFMTTLIRSGSTPRSIESRRSGSWTVMSSSATAAEARATAVTSGQERAQERMREPVAEELGHVLVQVEQQRHAGELLRERREGQEVGHGRHLDQVVAPAAMLARKSPGGECGEGDVLGQWPAKPTKRAVEREAHDAQGAVDVLLGASPGRRRQMHVDLVAGVDQRVALAADPRVAGEDGVDHDRDPARDAHPPFTSSQSRSFSASESASRSTPRDAASASTRR